MLDWLTAPWSEPVLLRAFAEVALIGLVGGLLGCWLVLYELSYSAESLAHALFPGLVGAALLGVPLLLGGIAGVLVGAVGVVLAGVTDNARWDGLGSLAIGVVLVLVAIVLVVEMGSLLVGESARPEDVARIAAVVERFPVVRRLIHLRTEHLGPDEIVVALKAEFDPKLSIEQLAAEIDRLEAEIRAIDPRATLIFVEPDVYRAPAARSD